MVGAFLIGLVMRGSSDLTFSAFGSVLMSVSVAGCGGCIYAHMLAPSYVADRRQVTTRLAKVWPYASRSAAWGLFAAGLGVLLGDVIPAPLQGDPAAGLSTKSLLAITFSSIGIAVAILETWREEIRAQASKD